MAHGDLTQKRPPTDWRRGEIQARHEIEKLGFSVHDANVLFRANCPNIDLSVYGRAGAIYVQTKSSERPAGKDAVVVDGSPWTAEQLVDAPIFNKHTEDYQASFIVIVHTLGDAVEYYVAPPDELERRLRLRGKVWADTLKRDGSRRSIRFRKELPRASLADLRSWDPLKAALFRDHR